MKNYISVNYDQNDKEFISIIDELPLWSAPFGLKLLDTIRMSKNIKALDVGFGVGFPLIEIAQRLGNTSKVFGLDIWDGGIERTKLKMTQYGVTNVEPIYGIAENMPFDNEYFDLVVSNNGINNVQDIKKSIEEIFRVSKKGSQFVFTVNLDGTMIEFYDVFRAVLEMNSMNEIIPKIEEHIYHKRRPVKELEGLLEKSGFKVDKINYDIFYHRYADGSAMLNHFFIKLAFLDSWLNIIPENKIKEIFGQIENELNMDSEKKGELKMSIPFATFDCSKL